MYMYTLVNYGIHGPCVACAELYTRPTYSLTLYTYIMWYIHVGIKLMIVNLEKGKILLFHWTHNRFTSHEPTYIRFLNIHVAPV